MRTLAFSGVILLALTFCCCPSNGVVSPPSGGTVATPAPTKAQATAMPPKGGAPTDAAPAPTDTPAPSLPTSTPSRPPLEILSSSSYTDVGYFHVVGEVQNNSTQPMTYVKVVATLYDSGDQVIGTDYTYTTLDVIPPGGKGPFETGTDQWQGVDHYKLQAEGNPGSMPRQGLIITSHSSYTDDIGYFHVQGEVQNNSSDPATYVEVIVTIYDAAGTVVGVDYTYTTLDAIPAGGASPFDSGLEQREGFDHYEVQVQ